MSLSNNIGAYHEVAPFIGAYGDDFQNLAPTFTSTPVTAAETTKLYSYSITTTDPNSPEGTRTITANASPTLPTWLSLVDNGDGTATLSGTPALGDIGAYNVTLTVTDAGGLSSTQSFTITVALFDPSSTFFNARFTLELPGSIVVAGGPSSEQNVTPPSSSQTTSDGKTNSSFTVELI